jgi:hypothetical protein
VKVNWRQITAPCSELGSEVSLLELMASIPSVVAIAPPPNTRIALPPIAELQDLTDIVLIQKLLNDAAQLEALLQQDLEQVMTKSDKVEAKLEYIDVIP